MEYVGQSCWLVATATMARMATYKVCHPRIQLQWIERQERRIHHYVMLTFIVTMATMARTAGYKMCHPRFQMQWIEQQ